MPAATYDRFDGGLDRRKSRATQDANRMWEVTNAFITTGGKLRKRPGLRRVFDVPSGTVGLRSLSGRLAVFSHQAIRTSESTGDGEQSVSRVAEFENFDVLVVPHPVENVTLARVHFAQDFNGFVYVAAEYADGSTWHSYLDAGRHPVWTPGQTLAVGTGVANTTRPSEANGFVYKVTTAGTSGTTEPEWPEEPGAVVSAVGGTAQWTAQPMTVDDPRCPHGKAVVIARASVYSAAGSIVRFSATDAPRDWSSEGDAGFIATGANQYGAAVATALGEFEADLVVFFEDGAQVWDVDPAPSAISLRQRLQAVGCRHERGVSQLAGDTVFLSDWGFRSIGVSRYTDNVQEADVGYAIDELIRQRYKDDYVIAASYGGGGQFWSVVDNEAWVYSFSRLGKISAWSRYVFAFPIDDLTQHQGMLYLRSGNTVYVVDETRYTDEGIPFEVTVEFPFLDAKTPGIDKQWTGLDMSMEGTATVAFRYDADDETQHTVPYEQTGRTQPRQPLPIEVVSPSLAPVIRVANAGPWQLDAFTLYYENLRV